jgi:hypothetical protein
MDGTPAEEQPAVRLPEQCRAEELRGPSDDCAARVQAAPAPTGATEQEQEAKLRARYGGLVPKKGLLAVSRKARAL